MFWSKHVNNNPNQEDVNLFLQKHVQNAKITQKLDGNYVNAMNRPKRPVSAKTEVSCKLLRRQVKENSTQYVDRGGIICEAEHIINEFS